MVKYLVILWNISSFFIILNMKTLKNILILVLTVSIGISVDNAQTSKSDKKAAKQALIRKSIEAQNYTFEANYVLPQRGGGHILTSEYDLRVTKDSVISYLPFFGRLYFDPPTGPNEGGIKFTSTKFKYEIKDKKKGGWEINIKPSDVKNLDRLLLNVSVDGYATLSVTSINRDFITFDGFIREDTKNK